MSAMNPLRLALTGDSIITRKGLFDARPGSQELRAVLREADVRFTNLEVLPNDFQGDPALESGGSHLAAPAAVLDELSGAGFDLFGFANNHALDYSISGLLRSMQALEARGLAYAGVGRTLEEARMPAYVAAAGGVVAMLACCSTFAAGQEAGAQRADMPGRPGLNPLHVEATYEVTAAQLETIKAIVEQSGMERERLEKIKLGFAFPPDDPEVVPMGEMNFRVGARPAVRRVAREKDVVQISRWVREAAGRADVVLVSLHGHQKGGSKEEPAEFQIGFARRMIEEGADLVVCHGPHLLRGMEMFRGKPIFYGLGNFVGQNELVYKLPADSYERFRIASGATPGEAYRQRYADDAQGFPADRRYWETVLAVLGYREGGLESIALYAVVLGFGEKPWQRGRPRLASGTEAREILGRFRALSAPFGTRFTASGDGAAVELGDC